MNLTSIRTLYKDMESVNRDAVTVGGWVRSIRDSKTFGFIVLSDGTFFNPCRWCTTIRSPISTRSGNIT